MQSPPLELVLDVAHLATRNLLRNAGDPDDDTISECTRRLFHTETPAGTIAFTITWATIAVWFWNHIVGGAR